MTTRAKRNRLPRDNRAVGQVFRPGAAALAVPTGRLALVAPLAAVDRMQIAARQSPVDKRPTKTARRVATTTASRIAARAMMTALGGKANTRAKPPAGGLPARRAGLVLAAGAPATKVLPDLITPARCCTELRGEAVEAPPLPSQDIAAINAATAITGAVAGMAGAEVTQATIMPLINAATIIAGPSPAIAVLAAATPVMVVPHAITADMLGAGAEDRSTTVAAMWHATAMDMGGEATRSPWGTEGTDMAVILMARTVGAESTTDFMPLMPNGVTTKVIAGITAATGMPGTDSTAPSLIILADLTGGTGASMVGAVMKDGRAHIAARAIRAAAMNLAIPTMNAGDLSTSALPGVFPVWECRRS